MLNQQTPIHVLVIVQVGFLEFRVLDFGLRVWGLGFGVQSLGSGKGVT